MRYYTNFIGSLFGAFGGQKIIAEPEAKDFFRDIHVRILETLVNSEVEELLFKDNPEALQQSRNTKIKAQKLIDYEMKKRTVDGYYGKVDLPALREIEEDMREDLWLNPILKEN